MDDWFSVLTLVHRRAENSDFIIKLKWREYLKEHKTTIKSKITFQH